MCLYCAYTVFCCTLSLIFHFTLVQVQYIHYLFRFKWKIHVRCFRSKISFSCEIRDRVFYNYVYHLQRTQVNNFSDIRTNSNCTGYLTELEPLYNQPGHPVELTSVTYGMTISYSFNFYFSREMKLAVVWLWSTKGFAEAWNIFLVWVW